MDAVEVRNGHWRPARRRRRDNCSRQKYRPALEALASAATDGDVGLASDLSRGRTSHVTHHLPRCRRKCAMVRAARRDGETRWCKDF